MEFWVSIAKEVPGLAALAFIVWRWALVQEMTMQRLMNHQSEEFRAAVHSIGGKIDELKTEVVSALFGLVNKLTNGN